MKRILTIALAIALALTLAGCNAGIIDTKLKYDKAIISMPDGTVISGKVDKWWDYENSDMVQVEIDGTVYLTHSCNVVLIKEG